MLVTKFARPCKSLAILMSLMRAAFSSDALTRPKADGVTIAGHTNRRKKKPTTEVTVACCEEEEE